MSKPTITNTPANFVVRCTGKLLCSCGEPVIANDVDLEEIPDGNGDKMINGPAARMQRLPRCSAGGGHMLITANRERLPNHRPQGDDERPERGMHQDRSVWRLTGFRRAVRGRYRVKAQKAP